jgi:phosphoribosylformylglycinamidine cyclo-ligase
MVTITYKDAGVDVHKADTLMDTLKGKIQSTFSPLVLNSIGGFGALTELPKGYDSPVLVSSTDGVGTKLKIAFSAGIHNTVGIDLVAMSANDVLTLGAKPLFFLDYFACGRIDDRIYKEVINGICEGCLTAGCSLIGGETAEMPSFYEDGEYDLAGFVIGIVEKKKIVDGKAIKEGDVLIALPSSGLHSNGYSLVRKVLLEVANLDIREEIAGIEGALYQELLKPTRIYVKPVLQCLETFPVKGMVHITGGGLPGNIKRIIPEGLSARVDLKGSRVPYIFKLIGKLGNIPVDELCATFNMGAGYVMVVDRNDAQGVIDTLQKIDERPFVFGEIEKASGTDKVLIDVQDLSI